MKLRSFGRYLSVGCVFASLGAAPAANAFSIMFGTDYFQTVAANVDTPYGLVDLCGDPFGIDPVAVGLPLGTNLGNTDTIVRRTADGLHLETGPAPIPIEIVALSLVSCQPITIGGADWDLHVTLAPSGQQPGSMTVTKTHDNGGTFTSTLPVNAKFTFTQVGNPTSTLDGGTQFFIFTQAGAHWDTRQPPGAMLVTRPYPDALANDHTFAPDSFFDVFYDIPFTNSTSGASHTVRSATPEPTTTVLALGACAAAALRRRRRKGEQGAENGLHRGPRG